MLTLSQPQLVSEHFRPEKACLRLHAYTCGDHGLELRPKGCDVSAATYTQRRNEDAFQPTQGLQTLGRSCSVPYSTSPALSNFIISGSKWACNFHFFMGLSNLLQMSPAGCNAFLPRKLFFLFSNFLVEDLPGRGTVLH